jgi:N-terminal domain of reverse transcriptase
MNTVETQPLYGWNTLCWKKIERVVFKLQTRIYRAQRRQKTVTGMHDKHQTIEEPCEGKLSRTVLKQR